MDQFGVLVDEYHGFKSQNRSAPLSKLKHKPPPTNTQPSYSTPSSSNSSSFVGASSSSYDLDGFFTKPISQDYSGGNDGFDIFSGNSGSVASNSYDDLMGLNSGVVYDDVFGILGETMKPVEEKRGNGDGDLIPGFGVDSGDSGNQGTHTKADPSSESNRHPHNSGLVDEDDPLPFFAPEKPKVSEQVSLDQLDDFVNYRGHKDSSSGQDKPKVSEQVSLDILDDFVNKRGYKDSSSGQDKPKVNEKASLDILDDFVNYKSSSAQNGTGSVRKSSSQSSIDDLWQKGHDKPNATAQDSEFDFFSFRVKKHVPPPAAPTVKPSGTPPPAFDFFPWDDDISSPGEFQEVDGEPRERRDARWKRHMRVKERMDVALAVKNQRDLESQYEQDEKRRLAETLEKDIKRWAAGKEGNLRALLSSLQQVLWPECGWRSVPLTDMITSDSVKKVYRKATLCVHPDKVQQKGASLQQKYIAEKVFDILKEAWNKFSSEELQ